MALKAGRVGASVFGNGDGDAIGASKRGFAELSKDWNHPDGNCAFDALGGLPTGQMVRFVYRNKTVDLPKVDVGCGGPRVKGLLRAVDFTASAAKELGFPNGVDTVSYVILNQTSLGTGQATPQGGTVAEAAEQALRSTPAGVVVDTIAGGGDALADAVTDPFQAVEDVATTLQEGVKLVAQVFSPDTIFRFFKGLGGAYLVIGGSIVLLYIATKPVVKSGTKAAKAGSNAANNAAAAAATGKSLAKKAATVVAVMPK